MLDSFAPLQMILDNVRCSQILQHYIGGFYVCFEIYWRSSVQGFGAWNKCFMLAVIAVNIRQHLDLCKGWELAPAHVLYSTCHSLKQMCTAAAPVPFVFWNFKNLLFLASEAQCNDSHQEYMFKENLRNCEPIDLSRFVLPTCDLCEADDVQDVLKGKSTIRFNIFAPEHQQTGGNEYFLWAG